MDVRMREVPAQVVVTEQRMVDQQSLERWLPEAMAILAAHCSASSREGTSTSVNPPMASGVRAVGDRPVGAHDARRLVFQPAEIRYCVIHDSVVPAACSGRVLTHRRTTRPDPIALPEEISRGSPPLGPAELGHLLTGAGPWQTERQPEIWGVRRSPGRRRRGPVPRPAARS